MTRITDGGYAIISWISSSSAQGIKVPERFEICAGAAGVWYLTDNDDAGRADDVMLPVLVSVPSDAKICRNVNTLFNDCMPDGRSRANPRARHQNGILNACSFFNANSR